MRPSGFRSRSMGAPGASMLPPIIFGETPRVLDLFAGLGGLSIGFAGEGFRVVGVDKNPISGDVFGLNEIGEHICADLENESILDAAPILIGGPPCRPWSVINTQKRRDEHAQHRLLERFFQHVVGLRPALFLMENVPSVKSDPTYIVLTDRARGDYSVDARVITYSDFGAATRRRRLITVGVRKGWLAATDFFRELQLERAEARAVGHIIGWLRDIPRDGFPDHDWSVLKTIDRYAERYSSGRFGWARLEHDKPAPSFGSVAKTYILHPDSGVNGCEHRVLSVREVLLIMGFSRDFTFPPGTSRTVRYQMAADAVSPKFSAACARTVRRLLCGPRHSGS